MTQFGAGQDLAAQCPRLPPPDGWRVWSDEDGPLPDALAQRAQAMAVSTPLGATESFPIPGVTTLLRVEPHTWNRDASGNLIEGCFRATAIYLPNGTPSVANTETVTPPEGDSGLTKTVTVLTAISLVVGIVATVATGK